MQKPLFRAIVLVALVMAALPGAKAANTITLTATPATATGNATATVTWSTSPTALSCTASGSWSGARAASGTEIEAPIMASASYTLTCQFPGDTQATLIWTPPTANVDGSTPANVQGYNIFQDDSVSPSATTAKQIAGGAGSVIPANMLTYTVSGLTPGSHNFAVQAWYCGTSSTCVTSDLSAFVAKTNAGPANVVQSAAVSVTAAPLAKPSTPTGLTVK